MHLTKLTAGLLGVVSMLAAQVRWCALLVRVPRSVALKMRTARPLFELIYIAEMNWHLSTTQTTISVATAAFMRSKTLKASLAAQTVSKPLLQMIPSLN